MPDEAVLTDCPKMISSKFSHQPSLIWKEEGEGGGGAMKDFMSKQGTRG